ncbi:MAG: bifunctional DNA primase/polymerase [Thermoleophilia bacterium]
MALGHAARGWAVLPLRPGAKVPATAHGLRDATTEPDAIREWWARWPTANTGIATGEASSLLVVDLDGADGMREFMRLRERHVGRDGARLGYAVATPRGLHLYFTHVDGLRNTASRIAPGVDTRGDGGYVVAAGSATAAGQYVVERHGDPGPLPEWLRHLLAPAPVPAEKAPIPSLEPWVTPTGSRYGLAALRSLLGELAGAQPGTRNHTLYRVAARVRDLIDAGHLSADDSWWRVAGAAEACGLSEPETARTMASARREVKP